MTVGTLEPQSSLDDWCKAPLGRCFVGQRFAVAAIAGRERPILVRVLHGALADDDVAQLGRPLLALASFVSVLDASGLVDVAASAFSALGEHAKKNATLLTKAVALSVKIVAPTPAGALIIGLERAFGLSLPELSAPAWHVVASKLAEHAEHAAITALQAWAASAAKGPELIDQLRAWLRDNTADANLERAAKALLTSERSLQRHLSDIGSSFRDEIASAKLTKAELLLLDPKLKITAIAAAAGFASLSHFNELFKRRHGVGAQAFREAKLALK